MRIHREGRKQVIGGLAGMALLNAGLFYFLSSLVVPVIVLCLSLFGAYTLISFYKEPHKPAPPRREGYINSPNDGKVVAIERVFEKDFLQTHCIQISVYMTFFNAHSNWVPVTGKVTHVSHRAGNYHLAYLPKSSCENEHSNIVIVPPQGPPILTRQIAGAFARRIVTYLHEGQEVISGEPLGFIKFGSRMDVFIPEDSEVLVKIGDQVRANKTYLARLNNAQWTINNG
ncbi:phosphatidylserine decarboxylase [Limibacterium fermenti]|mgnify:CR=1 FL=1|uniref:phosphatidylserine decarboxylase n=1 Tax=Limibacterium fermenti TaxID=3229863 RepID=UPI0026926230